jgi:hypothetical protein
VTPEGREILDFLILTLPSFLYDHENREAVNRFLKALRDLDPGAGVPAQS